MIAIIDYKAGNLASVSNALQRLGTDFEITSDPDRLELANGVIFPGVGHARAAMNALREKNMDSWLKQTQKPVLGICLGMQLLFSHSVEGDAACLGIIPGTLLKFNNTRDKVPHMGWNTTKITQNHPIFEGISGDDYFYFVHSFYAPVVPETAATCSYAGTDFTAAAVKDNFAGVQFHPEKSGKSGEKLLRNFLKQTEG